MSFRYISLAFLFAFAGILVSMDASAQERMKYPDEARDKKVEVPEKDKFSVSELSKTERGRELVEQLRVLRNSEATMGEKHPLLPKIKEEIERVKGLLRNRVVAEKIAEEMDDEDEVKQLATVLPGMDDDDLRRLVLRLIVRVDALEKEVKVLKSQASGGSYSSDAKSESTEPLPKANRQEPAEQQEAANPEEMEGDGDLFGGSLFDET